MPRIPVATASNTCRLRVLTVIPALMPSVVIGALRPLSKIEREGDIALRIRKSSDWQNEDVDWADVVVFYRSQEREDTDALFLAKRSGKAVIYEIDDNFFEISLGLPLGRYHRDPSRLHTLKRFLQMADLVRVYSDNLKEQALRFNENVDLIRSYFDQATILGAQRARPAKDAPVRIAYATGRAPDPVLERSMMTALETVCEQFGDAAEVTFWRKPPKALEARDNVVVKPPVPNYDRFVRRFFETGFDIGVAPLLDDVFHNSKTNNKYREYGGCGVAGVYSDVRIYRACVRHKENGMLAENTAESWTACLTALIADPALRNRIAANARSDVFANYTFENAVADWRRHLGAVAGPARMASR